jgi:hypothetical protein
VLTQTATASPSAERPMEEVRFAIDSPVEEARFEPSVPRQMSYDAERLSLVASATIPIPQKSPTLSRPGTEGSNPSPSSGESLANLTSSRWRLAVRSGFRMRHGPAQVSWPRLRPQRYGGNARAGRPHNPC